MCSRYALTAPKEAVTNLFAPVRGHDFPPRYNIAPTQPISIIRPDPTRARELALVRWGFVPSWVKTPAEFTLILNARAETCREKPSFRAAMRHRRCLIPATGFYEWTGPVKAKQPYLIEPASGGILAFAGLWEAWLGADGSEFDSAAIITVEANATMATIHDRMPAIIAEKDFGPWLNARDVSGDEAHEFLRPAPDDLLTLRPVSKRISNARVDDASLLEGPAKPLL